MQHNIARGILLLLGTMVIIGTMDALSKEKSSSAMLKVQFEKTEIQRQAAEDARREAEDFAERMKVQFNRAEANVDITIAAFDEMITYIEHTPAGDENFKYKMSWG